MNDIFNFRKTQQHHNTQTPNLACQRFLKFFNRNDIKLYYDVPPSLHNEINNLECNAHIGVFLREQNSAVVFSSLKSNTVQISWFAIAPFTKDVTNNVHLSQDYPTYSGQYLTSAILTSWIQNLNELSNTKFKCATAQRKKAGGVEEHREVQDPIPVIKYMTSMLPVSNKKHKCTFTKTIHDRVLWKKTQLPWRRSASWLAFKVMLKFIYSSLQGADYKQLMLDFLTDQLEKFQNELNPTQKREAVAKIAKRCKKLKREIPQICDTVATQLAKRWEEHVKQEALPTQFRDIRSASVEHPGVASVLNKFLETEALEGMKTKIAQKEKSTSVSNLYNELQEIFHCVCNKQRIPLESFVLEKKSLADNDPLMYSRIVLASFAQLMQMHKDACCECFELKDHKIELDYQIFDQLLCPTQIELQALMIVENYFKQFKNKSLPDILDSVISRKSFGYRYACSHEKYSSLRKDINDHNEKLREQKRRDVAEWQAMLKKKERNRHYPHSSRELRDYCCVQCDDDRYMDNISNTKKRVHEDLLPTDEVKLWNVLFEFDVPAKFGQFRDELYEIQDTLLHGSAESQSQENWQTYINERSGKCFCVNPTSVTLESRGKTMLRDHSGNIQWERDIKEFIVENPLDCQMQKNCIGYKTVLNRKIQKIPKKTTLQLPANERALQSYMLPNYTENDALVRQDTCPKDMSLGEYLALTTLNCATNLKLHHLLRLLESNHVRLHETYAVKFIEQTLFCSGSITDEWYRIHNEFADSGFVEKFVEILNRLVDEYQGSWKNANALLIIQQIALRIAEFNQHKKMCPIVERIQQACLEWYLQLEELMGKTTDDKERIRKRLVTICSLALQGFTLTKITNHNFETWIKFTNAVYENSNTFYRSNNADIFERRTEEAVERVKASLKEIVVNRLDALTAFASNHIGVKLTGEWKQQNDSLWWSLETDDKCIQMHVGSGDFLVNGCPVQRLPENICADEQFKRLFGNEVIEVLPKSAGCFITKFSRTWGSESNVKFEFCSVNKDDKIALRIYRIVNDESQLYVHNRALSFLPRALRECVHWLSFTTATTQGAMQRLCFHHEYKTVYQWFANTQHILDNGSPQKKLLNVGKQHVSNFLPLDVLENILAWKSTDNVFSVDVVRYNLQFILDDKTSQYVSNQFVSKDKTPLVVSPVQSLGSLVGLHSKLVLRSSTTDETIMLVPYGIVECKNVEGGFQTTTIAISENSIVPYYVYTVNQLLHEIKAGESLQGWLYLALLHGTTSYILPDVFQGATGCQLAMTILNNCQPGEPFDDQELDILHQIQRLSPTRQYYPKGKKVMETITWSDKGISFDGYALIVQQLLEQSEQLSKFTTQHNQDADEKERFRNHDQLELNMRACAQNQDLFPIDTFDVEAKTKKVSYEITVRNCLESLQGKAATVKESLSKKLNDLASDSVVSNMGYCTYNFSLKTTLLSQDQLCTDKSMETLSIAEWEGKSVLKYWLVLYKLALKESPQDFNMLLGFLIHNTEDIHSDDIKSVMLLSHICREKEIYGSDFPAVEDNYEFTQIQTCSFSYSYVINNICKKSKSMHRVHYATDDPYTINHSRISELESMWETDEDIHNKQWTTSSIYIDNNNGRSCWPMIDHIRVTSANRALHKFLRHIDYLTPSGVLTSCFSVIEVNQTLLPTAPKRPLCSLWTSPEATSRYTEIIWKSIYDAYSDDYAVLNSLGLSRPCTRLGVIRQELCSHRQTGMFDMVRNWAIQLDKRQYANHLRPEWIALELIMGIRIRQEQVRIAEHMLSAAHRMTTQLHMGKGKSSVIMPMLALTISDGNVLCRLMVLRSLYRNNMDEHRWKLNMLGRRCVTIPFTRDVKIPSNLKNLYMELQKELAVLITIPEHLKSFDLKIHEASQPLSCQLQEIDDWQRSHVRDVLDESDEILHFRNQLVYPMGDPVDLDGGNLRWQVCDAIVRACAIHFEEIQTNADIEFEQEKTKGDFPEVCRFIGDTSESFDWLRRKVLETVLENDSGILFVTGLEQLTREEKLTFSKGVLTNCEKSACTLNIQLRQLQLLLRGFLLYEVLLTCLQKRHRVQYGVDARRKSTMAVPFRAKDTPSERSEFSHPDMAILQTYLSWYYTGLKKEQFRDVIHSISNTENPCQEYSRLTSLSAIKISWSSINLEDPVQFETLYNALYKNMGVISFWLNSSVFPIYAKQFRKKISASPADTARKTKHALVGFSGTNGLQRIMPLGVKQEDLAETLDTNEIMDQLIVSQKSCQELHGELIDAIGSTATVLLDIGALVKDTNLDFARKWLMKSNKSYVVFFNSKNERMVLDRNGHMQLLKLSPQKDNLASCLIYLDDAHTRGTHLDFPNGTQAIATLGKGVTRDRLAQGCMRMRKLGKEHHIEFLASSEVFVQLNAPTGKAVLQWAKTNTQKELEDGALLWANQQVVYKEKEQAVKNQTSYIQKEIYSLEEFYQADFSQQPVKDIASKRYNTYPEIVSRCTELAKGTSRFAQTLDEEQEKELENELEDEREVERPPRRKARKPELMDSIKYFFEDAISKKDPFHTFDKAFPSNDAAMLYLSPEFLKVISNNNKIDELELVTHYHRNPIWFIADKLGNQKVALSPWEANQCYLKFKQKKEAGRYYMHMSLARTTGCNQAILCDDNRLTIPPCVDTVYAIYTEVSAFLGNLYWKDSQEADAFYHWTSMYPKPWISLQQQLVIERDMFVSDIDTRKALKLPLQTFNESPANLLKKIVLERRLDSFYKNSDLARLLVNGKKKYNDI